MRKGNGFFLLELLLSLSAWLMLSLFLIPELIFLREQSKKAQLERESLQLLYEELWAKEAGNVSFSNYTVVKGGTHFQIFWGEPSPSGQKEVCVQVEDVEPNEKKFCEFFQP
ncbi:MAG: competence type IV pilus minor pilin ComGE [Bacillota bacterium]|nr:competence type IV pilus minor pilin ComGE [Bacillota bacterium]